ncbi:MAG: S8 family serine peptidase, partial [Myxococcota bacterium]
DLNGNGQVDPSDWNGVDDDGNGFIDDLRGFDFAGSFDHDGDGFYDGPLDVSDPDPFDDRGHGTHVAGTIAAVGNNGIGIVGVAPLARIMPLKGFPAEGEGLDSDLWRAVLYAAMNGADVINNSWSCRPYCPDNPLAEEILEIVHALNVVVVTSAGNAQRDSVINSPENLWETITVGASGYDDLRSQSISNFGWVVDLMAPGGGPDTDLSVLVARRNILSLRSSGYTAPDFVVDDAYLRWAGTSMAAPHVSGVVALLRAQRPELDYESIRRILRQTAADISEPGHDYDTGSGRLDARAALEWTDLPDMRARLYTPRNWEVFARGEEIVIEGTILGQDLESWTLEMGVGSSPNEWTMLGAGTEASQGVLASWPTDELDQGAYVIRLSARSRQGRTFLEFIQISLESNSFLRLSSPGRPAVQPDISFPWVVWSSRRDPDDPTASKEDLDLFVTHLRTGREQTLLQASGDQTDASISTRGKRVVISWWDESVEEDREEIRGCSFSSRHPDCDPFVVSNDPSNFPSSRAMGEFIVWLQDFDGRRDLLSCNVSRDGSRCEPASLGHANGFDVSFPAGTGNTLIWSEFGNDFRFGFCEMDGQTGLCPRVEVAERTPALSRPAASGNLVAWVAFTGGLTGPLRLCEVDLETGLCPWIFIDRG